MAGATERKEGLRRLLAIRERAYRVEVIVRRNRREYLLDAEGAFTPEARRRELTPDDWREVADCAAELEHRSRQLREWAEALAGVEGARDAAAA